MEYPILVHGVKDGAQVVVHNWLGHEKLSISGVVSLLVDFFYLAQFKQATIHFILENLHKVEPESSVWDRAKLLPLAPTSDGLVPPVLAYKPHEPELTDQDYAAVEVAMGELVDTANETLNRLARSEPDWQQTLLN